MRSVPILLLAALLFLGMSTAPLPARALSFVDSAGRQVEVPLDLDDRALSDLMPSPLR